VNDVTIEPGKVHEVLGRHVLVDGFDMVLDLEKSRGRRLFDSRRGRWFLDMYSFFASAPVGLNHPALSDEAFRRTLLRAAVGNPTNSDVYTTEYAEFVDTFARLAMPPSLPHAFFIAGGALAVENALKAAMDWKVRRNRRSGVAGECGHQVLHLRDAFHGRSGYTLSLTNTLDPRKYEHFARFDWPRVTNPALRFPIDEQETARVQRLEEAAFEEIEQAFAARPGEIAAIIVEPIQGEGGDLHFRAEFFRGLRALADRHEALLVFDEVQSGVGLTGRFWAYQHFGVEPDLIAFGKKMQVCGMLAGPRLDEEPENVFTVSSRINSTWGGSLADMVRAKKFLEIVEEEHLVEHAAEVGCHLLGALRGLAAAEPGVFSNPRGRGLMCAVDLPDTAARDAVVAGAYERGLLILGCGQRSVRFRPALDVTPGEVDEAVAILVQAAAQSRAA
jgi:L-lysine 6-transaminase